LAGDPAGSDSHFEDKLLRLLEILRFFEGFEVVGTAKAVGSEPRLFLGPGVFDYIGE
jgi:hypothetical protein